MVKAAGSHALQLRMIRGADPTFSNLFGRREQPQTETGEHDSRDKPAQRTHGVSHEDVRSRSRPVALMNLQNAGRDQMADNDANDGEDRRAAQERDQSIHRPVLSPSHKCDVPLTRSNKTLWTALIVPYLQGFATRQPGFVGRLLNKIQRTSI